MTAFAFRSAVARPEFKVDVLGLAEFCYWAACAPSHKMGFRSSVSKSGLPGEGRHEGLVPRNDVFTNGFI